MEKVGIFFGNLEYISAIWDILWHYNNLVAIQYISPCFGIMCQKKSGKPAARSFQIRTKIKIRLKKTNSARTGKGALVRFSIVTCYEQPIDSFG
jgi:hypothetical protein